ncbi:MAG: type 1 glutamine amidotransferase [Solirubrobacterales bacterium]
MSTASLPPLILQHEASTPADLLGEWLRERGIAVETVPVWERGAPPDPTGRPWICSLGSDQTPGLPGPAWVEGEIAFLRAALAADVPVLGLCFGGQALAVAAGGSVHRADPPAAGWAEVETAAPDLIAPGPWLHFHYSQLEPPPQAIELARSPAGVAAFRLGRNLGLQFHPETGPEVAASWAVSERDDLVALGIEPDSVTSGGDALGPRTRELAFDLFDTWHRDVLGA